MRTIIAGSRDKYWPQNFDYMDAINQAVADSGFEISEVVCGMANGIDLKGKEWADYLKIPVKEFPANWHPKGRQAPMDRAAGYKRNQQMSAYGEALIAIWDGVSSGTRHMIDIAHKLKLPTYIHIPGVKVTEITGLRDSSHPTANIYGCQPCPRCRSDKRYVACSTCKHVTCDDCLFMEPITRDVF